MSQERSPRLPDGTLPNTLTTETPPAAGTLAPGQRLGPYEIGEKVGEGGMGAVYRAIDTRLNREVAIKVIAREGNGLRGRFFLEAKAASSLNHPNIVTIYEYESEGGLEYLVMEYLKGETLDRVRAAGTPLVDLLRYAGQAANAVDRAHRAGIVHRDLKPRNIMVTGPSDQPGVVKVLDFGLAKTVAAAADPEAAETLTRTGVSVGTPAYMSPEQARGEPTDHRSDIFSFGIVLYELVCGRRPFHGANALAVLHGIAHETPPPPAGVPRPLAELIENCLAKDKADRPQSMQEVHGRLTLLVQQSGSAAPRPATLRRAAIAAAAVAGAGLIAASANWLADRPAPLPPLTLTVAIEVQRPGGQPYHASPTEIFHSGDRFRLRLESSQPGFLYVINWGAGENAAPRYWVLYPPEVRTQPEPANRRLETDWNLFDANPGAERLWTVWAERPLTTIDEALRSSDLGEIRQEAHAARIQSALSGLAPAAVSGASSPGRELRLTANRSPLGALLELRHQ
jgi:hypothetical protein